MSDVLLVMGLSLTVLVVVPLAFLGLTLRSLRRRNRVGDRRAAEAPLPWLVSPSSTARVHRRLRDAVGVMRAALPSPRRRGRRPDEPAPLADLADQIEAHAIAIDRDLVLAARLRSRHGVAARAELTRQAGELEQLANRVAMAASAANAGRRTAEPTADALRRMAEQLDALDAARDELARLEADPAWILRA